ncbi:hypothetical protein PS652_00367 [Pseudomonas fluorescens]|uniref:Uncharacterized protein n=2 Tax=Pseudomonas TaxID=286 RepID=A0A5E6Q2P0_PSEFL|nr:hypothetical protein PS652_00677 [Pseudomonas fluorescens]
MIGKSDKPVVAPPIPKDAVWTISLSLVGEEGLTLSGYSLPGLQGSLGATLLLGWIGFPPTGAPESYGDSHQIERWEDYRGHDFVLPRRYLQSALGGTGVLFFDLTVLNLPSQISPLVTVKVVD